MPPGEAEKMAACRKIYHIFRSTDLDGNGHVDRDEFTEALRAGMDRLDERICVDILGVCKDAEEMSSLPRVAKKVEKMTLEPPEEATAEDIKRAKSRATKKKKKKRKSSVVAAVESKSEL